MAFLGDIPLIGGVLAVALPFLIVLSIVVFVHEFGHYIVGRWSGIHAETFSIGFGRPLLGWTDRRGTRWQLALWPLGGFVKFVGDMDPASAGGVEEEALSPEERARAFHHAPLRARAATVLAGPVANFLLSILIFAVLVWNSGIPSDAPVIGDLDDRAPPALNLQTGDRVVAVAGEPVADFGALVRALERSDGAPVAVLVERGADRVEIPVDVSRPAEVIGVVPDGAAAAAGIAVGDTIIAVDDRPTPTSRAVQLSPLDRAAGQPMRLTLARDGATRTVEVTPQMMERPHPVTGEVTLLPTLGLSFNALGGIAQATDPVGPIRALGHGAAQVWFIVTSTLDYLYGMLFEGGDSSQLGGPIYIANTSAAAAERGLDNFVYLIAVLSTSIGLLNLFPIPVLDGGHLMFYAIEALRGRPIGGGVIRFGTLIGLSLVLLLMVFATYNDVLRVLSQA